MELVESQTGADEARGLREDVALGCVDVGLFRESPGSVLSVCVFWRSGGGGGPLWGERGGGGGFCGVWEGLGVGFMSCW
jgi:hypothetical protein